MQLTFSKKQPASRTLAAWVLLGGFVLLAFACKTNKVASDCKGKPNPDCLCTEQYKPVCGCDNQTYSNACVAKCAGVKTYTEGRCPQEKQ